MYRFNIKFSKKEPAVRKNIILLLPKKAMKKKILKKKFSAFERRTKKILYDYTTFEIGFEKRRKTCYSLIILKGFFHVNKYTFYKQKNIFLLFVKRFLEDMKFINNLPFVEENFT